LIGPSTVAKPASLLLARHVGEHPKKSISPALDHALNSELTRAPVPTLRGNSELTPRLVSSAEVNSESPVRLAASVVFNSELNRRLASSPVRQLRVARATRKAHRG